jgi:hypothetical protein
MKPGISRVVAWGSLRRRHRLPFPGKILVDPGDTVEVGQMWCRGRMRSGVTIVDLPKILSVSVEEAMRMVVAGVGTIVDEGTVLAEEPGKLRSNRQWVAPFRGAISEVSHRGVAVFVRDTRDVALYCRLAGSVISVDSGEDIVVEGRGVAIAAALGGGGRAYGPIRFLESGERQTNGHESHSGAILVTPEPLRPDWVKRALEAHSAAIVAPSVSLDLASSLGLVPTIAGMVSSPGGLETIPVPIVLTEGLGIARMPRVLQGMFRSSDGELAAVSGSRRPGDSEVLLSALSADRVSESARKGISVRVTVGPDAGTEGQIVDEYPQLGRSQSGIHVQLARVRKLEGGALVSPIANLESFG